MANFVKGFFSKSKKTKMSFWLVVLTILKNISPWEGLSHILWKIKNVWNHQPGFLLPCSQTSVSLLMHNNGSTVDLPSRKPNWVGLCWTDVLFESFRQTYLTWGLMQKSCMKYSVVKLDDTFQGFRGLLSCKGLQCVPVQTHLEPF